MGWLDLAAAPSRAGVPRQGSGLPRPLPAFLRPITALDPFPASKQFPGEACAIKRGCVEKIEAAVIVERGVAPLPIGNQHVACKIRRIRVRGEQDRLPSIVGSAAKGMRQEARRALVPKNAVESGEERLIGRDNEQPAVRSKHFFGETGDYLFGRSVTQLVK